MLAQRCVASPILSLREDAAAYRRLLRQRLTTHAAAKVHGSWEPICANPVLLLATGSFFLFPKRQQLTKRQQVRCRAIATRIRKGVGQETEEQLSQQENIMNANIQKTADGRGKCLVATSVVDVGTAVLTEDAAFIYGLDRSPTRKGMDQVLDAFKQKPESVQAAILQLFCPADAHASLESDAYYQLNEEEQRVLGILAVNAIQLPESNQGGAFVMASRANHSCQPNVSFRFDGKSVLSLVAIRPLKVGDEVLVSYLPESDLLLPIGHRHRRLQPWNFACACVRCDGEVDDSRAMSCAQCGTGEFRPTSKGEWLACNCCGSSANADELSRCQAKWWLRLNSIEPTSKATELKSYQIKRSGLSLPQDVMPADWMHDVVELHRDLVAAQPDAPAQDGHWLCAAVAELAAEAHLWRGEFEEAAMAARSRSRYIHRVLAGASTRAYILAQTTANLADTAAR